MTRKEKNPMTGSTLSVLVWGLWLLINGAILIAVPAKFATVMGLAAAPDLMLSMVGLLTAVLGFYYVLMARYRLSVLYPWKIVGHITGVAIMLFLYFSRNGDASLIITAATDALAAMWTALALIREGEPANSGIPVNPTPERSL